MQSLLSQLNSVPGVVGTMVCDSDGQILAQVFPSTVDTSTLAQAGKIVADGQRGLEPVTGPVGMVDLRYAKSRIVVRRVSGAHLFFLCTPSLNVQSLAMFASVTIPKLEKLLTGRPSMTPAGAPAAAASSPGRLYAVVQRINAVIDRRKLDPFKIRGEIAIKSGFSMAFVDEATPDDPDKLAKLTAAAAAVLGEPV